MSSTKKGLQRILSMVLSIVMVIALLPSLSLKANAAYTWYDVPGVENLQYRITTIGSWTVENGKIFGTVTSTKKNQATSAILVFQYTGSDSDVTLSFDYQLTLAVGSSAGKTKDWDGNYVTQNTGSMSVTNNNVDSSVESPYGPRYTQETGKQSWSGPAGAGKGIQITLMSCKSSKEDLWTTPTTITITNLKLSSNTVQDIATTFQPAENGSYTVDGTAITEETSLTKSSDTSYTLAATPADGYEFLGWYSETEGKYLSTAATAEMSFSSASTVTAKFAKIGTAVFDVSGQRFTDLNEANSYAAKEGYAKIILVSDGTIPAGNYTISSGVTLLIPFDDDNTMYTTTPTVGGDAIPSGLAAYRTLKMASGASIEVNGAISVSAKLTTKNSGYASTNGGTTGKYGLIAMEKGSKITLNNGAALYTWGYITGDGEIEAKSGADVYEPFQIMDWRGGSAAAAWKISDKLAFLFSQYYIQNIEASLTLDYGSNEYVYASFYAAGSAYSVNIKLIGTTDCMFTLTGEDSSLTKTYDPSTDRLIFDINGDTSLSSIDLSVMGMSVSSSGYILPINNNITLNVQSGTTHVTQDVALQAGVQATVAKDATLTVDSGSKLFVYDSDEWAGGYVYPGNSGFIPVTYSPTRTYTRTTADLKDVVLDVNGTISCEGELYTTAGGADITSSEGGGVVTFVSDAGQETTTEQMTQSGSTLTAAYIDITSAKLHNADGSYTETSEATAGDNYIYKNGKWVKEGDTTEVTITYDANGGTGTMEAQTVTSGEAAALTTNAFTRDGYTFSGWNTAADGTGTNYADSASVTLDADTTLYAQWTANTYTVTWVDEDGTELEKDTDVAYGTTPEYNGETPTKEGDAQYRYTFSGWTPEVTAVTGDVTYKATFTEGINTYTVIWQDWDETELEKDVKVAYGTTPEFNGNTPTRAGDDQYSYTFKGWSPAVDTVTGDITYTAVYEQTVNQYTITWKNADGTELKTEQVAYGETPVWSGETPTKTAEGCDYTFKGWTPEITAVTGDVTYTAEFDEAKWNGVHDYNGDTYFYKDGKLVEYAGLVRVVKDNGEINYYYFGEDNKAFKATEDKNECKVEKANGLSLPEGNNYKFDENGVIVHFDSSINGIYYDETSSNYYYCIDGIIIANGLMKIDDSYYYARTSTGAFVRNCNYWVSKTNGLLDEGIYTFDDTGKIVFPEETEKKNGIVEENGSLYYYVDGVVTGAGLIKIGDDYYYVRTSTGEVIHGRSYWVTATNNLLPVGQYTFADDGKLILPDTTKSGIVSEDGSLYYYVDGERVGAGLIKIGDDYYYVRTSNGEVIHGRSYWVTATNDLLPAGQYQFADDGRMIVK